LARQRTLQASVDWSYELLSDTERSLFCALAIFAGSFDLDAAAAVASGRALLPGDVLGLLLGLVDKSMVTPVEDGDRYRLLETLRQYGQARLADTGELAAVRDRHLEWAAALFDPRDYPFVKPVEALAPVVDDLRGALEWALFRGDSERGHQLGHMVGIWDMSFGNPAAASSAFSQALALEGEDPGLVLRLRMGLAMCEWEMGRRDPGADAALIETARALGDDSLLALCLMSAGERTMTRPLRAIGLFAEAADAAGRAGATALLEVCQSSLATAHAYNGDWAEAEGLAALVTPGDPGLSPPARMGQLARWLACRSNGTLRPGQGGGRDNRRCASATTDRRRSPSASPVPVARCRDRHGARPPHVGRARLGAGRP
jgi:hypothetical protein